jgi:muramoyltetrapeptide carboxypeptidase LdcA involved in peptidoglycan recycling
MIKPNKLNKGDVVAIVSPSWGGPSKFSHIYENGIKFLEKEFGLRIKEYPTARMDAKKLTANPKLRAKDINDAFADKEVKAIFATIGGDDSLRILKYLDLNLIKKNPKILMGYSDTATLLTLLNQNGLVTFNGPSIMGGFSQMNNFPECKEHIKKILFENPEGYLYKPYPFWSNNYLDWSKKENVGKVSDKIKNEGWHWIQGNNIIQGELFGGCIEIVDMLKGTEFWPKKSFWKNKILFIETSEDKPTPEQVKYSFTNLGVQGIFNKISAVLVGRARDYTQEDTKKLEDFLVEVISNQFGHPEMPIITNMDFGHTDPQFILPLGIKAEINCKNKTFKLLETPCE